MEKLREITNYIKLYYERNVKVSILKGYIDFASTEMKRLNNFIDQYFFNEIEKSKEGESVLCYAALLDKELENPKPESLVLSIKDFENSLNKLELKVMKNDSS